MGVTLAIDFLNILAPMTFIACGILDICKSGDEDTVAQRKYWQNILVIKKTLFFWLAEIELAFWVNYSNKRRIIGTTLINVSAVSAALIRGRRLKLKCKAQTTSAHIIYNCMGKPYSITFWWYFAKFTDFERFTSCRNGKTKWRLFANLSWTHRYGSEVTSHLTQRYSLTRSLWGGMAYCAAFGCNDNSSKGARVRFFDFPKDKSLRKQWILKVKRKSWRPSRHARVVQSTSKKALSSRARRSWSPWGLQQGNCGWSLVHYLASLHTTSRLRSIRTEVRTRNKDDRRYVREIEWVSERCHDSRWDQVLRSQNNIAQLCSCSRFFNMPWVLK